jgi:hypothetical protein
MDRHLVKLSKVSCSSSLRFSSQFLVNSILPSSPPTFPTVHPSPAPRPSCSFDPVSFVFAKTLFSRLSSSPASSSLSLRHSYPHPSQHLIELYFSQFYFASTIHLVVDSFCINFCSSLHLLRLISESHQQKYLKRTQRPSDFANSPIYRTVISHFVSFCLILAIDLYTLSFVPVTFVNFSHRQHQRITTHTHTFASCCQHTTQPAVAEPRCH